MDVVSTIALPEGISGANFCAAKYGPFMFRLNISSYTASDVLSNGAIFPYPALMKRKSTAPNSDFARAARASMCASTVASLTITMAFFPSSSRAASALFCVLPVTSTRAP